MASYLEKLDELMQNLESAVGDAPEKPFTFAVAPGVPPRPATIRIITEAFTSLSDRKPRPSEAYEIHETRIVLRARNPITRGVRVEITLPIEKSGREERMMRAQGPVSRAQRISGAYEIEAVIETRELFAIPVHSRFLQYAGSGDAAAWNRWCADLEEGAVLRDLDLSRNLLVGFDLSCADLSGSNLRQSNLTNAHLAGADLTGCNLDSVLVGGADFFRARLPRRYLGLLVASGTVEAESVVLVD